MKLSNLCFWRNPLARPRLLKLEQGDITLSGFPKEVTDALQAHIELFNKPQTEQIILSQASPIVEAEQSIVVLEDSSLQIFPSSAVGVTINPTTKQKAVVVVGYDLTTKQARVLESKDVEHVHDVSSDFIKMVDKLGLI